MRAALLARSSHNHFLVVHVHLAYSSRRQISAHFFLPSHSLSLSVSQSLTRSHWPFGRELADRLPIDASAIALS